MLAPALIMLLDRREPLILIEGNITPFNVRSGDDIKITLEARESRACEGRLHRLFIDSSGIVHASVSEPTVYYRTYDRHTFQKVVTTPKGMAPGPAIYTTRIERWCNPLQRLLWPIKSDGLDIPFNVIE